jgi:hypothetical protein
MTSDVPELELARLTPRARRAVAPVVGFLLLTWTGFYFAAQFELGDVRRHRSVLTAAGA